MSVVPSEYASLAERLYHFSALLQNVTEGTSQVDEQGHYTMVGTAYAGMLGYTPKEMEGMEWEANVHPEDREKMRGAHQYMLSNDRVEVEARIVKKDGSIFFAQVVMIKAHTPENKFIGHYGLLKDLTEHKQLDQLKDEFTKVVSREFRAPLAILRDGLARMLDGKMGAVSESQNRFLTSSIRTFDRLKLILSNLVDISDIEAGKLEIERERVDLVGLVMEVVSGFRESMKRNGLELKMSFSEEALEIYADKEKLTQVFNHLFNNAIKFTEKGFIEVFVLDRGDTVECGVVDSGKGIAEADLPNIFNRFQFGKSLEDKGADFGLSICKGLIELHHGKIWVESKPGQGSRFTFSLPRFTEEQLLEESAVVAFKMALKRGVKLSSIVVDIKGLDKIEAQGSKATLKSNVARLIKGCLRRPTDMMYEWDRSILVLLPETEKVGAEAAVKRFQQAVTEHFSKEGLDKQVEISYRITSNITEGDLGDEGTIPKTTPSK